MPNPLQWLQQPGVWLVGVMTLLGLYVLVVNIALLVRHPDDKPPRLAINACLGAAASGVILLTVFGGYASRVPQTSGVTSWFAFVALGVAIGAGYLAYWVFDNWDEEYIDITLLALAAMSYLTLACELWLIGRQYDTGGWTSFVRSLPAVSLWAAAVLILVLVVLIGLDLWAGFTDYRRNLRRSSRDKQPKGQDGEH